MPCKFLNQVKFFELTLDNFGMLQCTEWEPNGSFNKLSGTTSASGQGVNYSQERFLILHCHLTHVKLSCIVHPSLTFWRFWPLCLMSSLLMEFFYSTYLLQVTLVHMFGYFFILVFTLFFEMATFIKKK
ncbi:putative protein SCAI [Helianthus annuus]|nr:putative protein SCAI [Helianthus annuus]